MTNPTPRDSAQLPSSLMQHALEALEYHQEQTRPIEKTQATIAAIREALRAQAAGVVPGMRDERYFLEGIIDIWDDSDKHPDHRVYVAGALGEVIEEARALLSTTPASDPPAHVPADVDAPVAAQLSALLTERLQGLSATSRAQLGQEIVRLFDAQHPTPEPAQAVDAPCRRCEEALPVQGKDGKTHFVFGTEAALAALAARQPQAQQGGGEVVAWAVWWGIGQMRPLKTLFDTEAEADQAASCIKSNTEVRPVYAALATKEQRS